MKFDIHIQIDDQSPEGQVLKSIVSRDRVSPNEAARTALREFAEILSAAQQPPVATKQQSAEARLGLFAHEPDLLQRLASAVRDAKSR